MADAEANLEATRAQFQATEEEGQRRQLALWIDYHQSVVEAKPILQIRAPNLTFAERLAFHGTDRSAELIPFVGGHTESDVVLFLSQEGIAFMSDLLFIGAPSLFGRRRSRQIAPYFGGSLRPRSQAACAGSRAGRDGRQPHPDGAIRPYTGRAGPQDGRGWGSGGRNRRNGHPGAIRRLAFRFVLSRQHAISVSTSVGRTGGCGGLSWVVCRLKAAA